jgi:hypothetical protein
VFVLLVLQFAVEFVANCGGFGMATRDASPRGTFMSPEIEMIFILSTTFSIIYGVGLLNMWLARRKMSEWKKYSTYYFLLSIWSHARAGQQGAVSEWIWRFAYLEEDASRLANFQTITRFESFVCVLIWWAIASMLIHGRL